MARGHVVVPLRRLARTVAVAATACAYFFFHSGS